MAIATIPKDRSVGEQARNVRPRTVLRHDNTLVVELLERVNGGDRGWRSSCCAPPPRAPLRPWRSRSSGLAPRRRASGATWPPADGPMPGRTCRGRPRPSFVEDFRMGRGACRRGRWGRQRCDCRWQPAGNEPRVVRRPAANPLPGTGRWSPPGWRP
jgi:hypothetical protein